MAHIDVFVKTWQRLNFNDATAEELLSHINEQGEIDDALFEREDFELEWLDSTEITLTPFENDGYATIEVWENARPRWGNGNLPPLPEQKKP